ncbi:DUF4065 domain-containing protein [Vibrio vulnificus]|uniref:Panacea domain-containing protein n=1 Tax=Vibrio TaxID=662 RepID=UPI0010236CCA|nr:type II toxin-antitoxin system antitoxin SocA domain-containing protein [Vibrio vulnificus]EKF9663320.1 DUF4065 domain-containing protein [Vibrio cholerae]EGR0063745.1 DUF4065 domain-containing protein [Vibrio vulnificus]EIU7748416.1 DUF4065 domain-containing protein [Vibrio vulnificus]EJN6717872.1 DUF4065 domain-containing protein [Vibrio vulnificus]EJQ9994189.1 DUF4065 domain-containing protein [Vibrio vulnificus]
MCSQALANFYIEKSREDQIPLTNMQLQKLVFIGFGWVYALTGRDLLDGENFEAWQHGPVLPSVYHEVKHNGDRPITDFTTDYDFTDNVVYIPKVKTEQTRQILGKVWETYKNFNAWSLRELTHQKDTPWANVYDANKRGVVIPKEEIDKYYTKYLKDLLG